VHPYLAKRAQEGALCSKAVGAICVVRKDLDGVGLALGSQGSRKQDGQRRNGEIQQ
jgi:hypothetical protein